MKQLFVVALTVALAVVTAGCRKEKTPAEKMKDGLSSMWGATKDAAKDAADVTADAAKKASKAVKDAVED